MCFVQISPAAPDVLYAATREGTVFRSDDSGTNWLLQSSPLDYYESSLGVRRLIADAGDSRRTYMATPSGLRRSDDGGLNWQIIHPAPLGYTIEMWEFGIDPNDREVLYLSGRFRVPATESSEASYFSGLLRSTDGGEQWALLSREIGVGVLAIDGNDSKHMVAGGWVLDASPVVLGILSSLDGGVTWTQIYDATPYAPYAPSITECGKPGMIISSVAIDPTDRQRILVGGRETLSQTTDGGVSWSQTSDGIHALPARSIALYAMEEIAGMPPTWE
jgi:photosystem II stability/assembly factor-like uncharacterized protein